MRGVADRSADAMLSAVTVLVSGIVHHELAVGLEQCIKMSRRYDDCRREETHPLDDVRCPNVPACAPCTDSWQSVLPCQRPLDKVGGVGYGDMLSSAVGGEGIPCAVVSLHERWVWKVASNNGASNSPLLNGSGGGERKNEEERKERRKHEGRMDGLLDSLEGIIIIYTG